jgi:hypothetical protein
VTDTKQGGTVQRPSPFAQRRDTNFYRLALLVLLTLLAVVGLHASSAQPAWDSHTKAHDAEVAGALEALVIVLFLVLVVRNRRPSVGPPLVTRLRTALMYVLAGGMVALASVLVDLLVNLHLPPGTIHGTKTTSGLRPGLFHLPKPTAPHSSRFPTSAVFYGLVAALLLAAIVVLAVKALRSRRLEALPELQPPAEEYGDTLQDAILGGQRALLELDDARAAIIACYVAMEESLARAGAARARAETPDELLAKAAKELLISPGPASRLTSLFYEARFSSHPLDDGDKQVAEQALAELATELLGRRVAEPAVAETGAGL